MTDAAADIIQDESPDMVGIAGDPLTAIEAEQQLIATLMADHEAFAAIEEQVFTENFYVLEHRKLFTLFCRAFREGWKPSYAQLVKEIDLNGKPLYVTGENAKQYLARLAADHDPALRPEELAREIFEAAERRLAEQEDMRAAPPDVESKFGAVRFRDLDLPGPEYDYLIKGVLTRGERSLLIGPSGSGKSFVAMQIAFAVAMGEEFLGRRVRKGLVCYQAGEGARGLKKRARAIRKSKSIPNSQNVPFVLLTSPVDLYSADTDTTLLIQEIKGWAATYKYEENVDLELVVIDTLSAATPGANENASEDMSKILARCAAIAKVCNCHVMLVHHLNAAGTKPRGHSSLFANIENAIEISLTDRTCVGLADDGHEVTRKVRTARVIKQKDDQADGMSWDFTLKQVYLGKDNDGDAITSCVIVGTTDDGEIALAGAEAAEKKGTAFAGFRLSKQEGLFFDCVLDALAEHGINPPADLQLPASVGKVVDYEHVKTFMARKMLREEDNTPEGKERHRSRVKAALKRAREALTTYKVVGVHSPFIWWTGRPVKGFAKTQPRAAADDREPADNGNFDLGEFY